MGGVGSWGPPAPHDAGGEGGAAAAPQSRSREVLSWGCRGLRCNQEAHQTPWGGGGGSNSCSRVNVENHKCVPAAHLGSTALIPSLRGTRTRGTWVLDLQHTIERSGASSEGQVFWPWAQVDLAQGHHCPCPVPLLSPIPSTWSLPLPLLPLPRPPRWRRSTLRMAPFAGTAPLWTW